MFTTDDLHLLFGNIWQELTNALEDRAHPFRLPAVATVTRRGEAAVRTVVLRSVDAAHHRLCFYTDARSPKVDDLRHQPRVAWHFWDHRRQVQLRLQGSALLRSGDDPEAWARWQACPTASRLAYAKPRGSGEAIDHPDADPLPSSVSGVDPEHGRQHFIVVETTIDGVDFYEIRPDRHRRAQWQIAPNNPRAIVTGRWVSW